MVWDLKDDFMYNIINYNFCMKIKIKINILNVIIIISTQTRF